MKSDRRSIAIRVSWILGVLYVLIMIMMTMMFFKLDESRFIVPVWMIVITWVAYMKRKELLKDMKEIEK